MHPLFKFRPRLCLALALALALAFALTSTASLAAAALAAGERPALNRALNFNPGWKFLKADPAGAAAPAFNDAAWATVSAPHTFNDTDTFDNWSTPGHRGEQLQWSGRTWYRKAFTLPAALQGKRVYIEFEGVRQVAEVYLNGTLLGTCKTGFTPFGFDLTPHLKFGAPNVLAVMVDNRFMKDPLEDASATPTGSSKKGGAKKGGAKKGAAPKKADVNLHKVAEELNARIPESVDQLAADQIPWNNPHWHPAHGGIYRNVKLYVVDPLHISLPLYSFLQTAGPYVYATEITEKSAQINLEVPVENGRANAEPIQVKAVVFDMDGKPVLTLSQSGQAQPGQSATLKLSGSLANPQLWEPSYPYLYHVAITLSAGGQVIDSTDLPLGIRAVRWDVATGFYINGHHEKLHGWGQKPTDEWPGLGAAQPDWLHFFTINLMKQAGGNFVRWGHCAAGPSLITACDCLGLVVDQPGVDGESDTVRAAWTLRAAAFRDMLIYYRNNPSILVWEGGNQKVTREHAAELRGLVDKFDPHGGRAYAHRRADKVTAEFMTVGVGTEGGQEIKTLPVFEGEYDREEAPRRVWDGSTPRPGGVLGYPEAQGQTYQLTSEQFAANEVGQYVKKLGSIAHAGGANWIFSDSTSGGRVACEVARAGGEVDGVRLPKEAYYVCQVMFRPDPAVHIIGHWNYPAGTKKDVFVASNCDEVELFVNGKSLGKGQRSDRYLFTFNGVAFEPGEIKAVGLKNGKEAATQSRHTAGEPVALKLTPLTGPHGLQADGSDVALFDVEAVDAKGERSPTFEQRVDFTLGGPAVWRGGYNSGKINSINNTFLNLECGVNRVAIRSTLQAGQVTLKAATAGLNEAQVTLPANPVDFEQGISKTFPGLPAYVMATKRAYHPVAEDDLTAAAAPAQAATSSPASSSGKFIKAFNYSGPTAGIRVEQGAADGKQVFCDRPLVFANLPAELQGADFIQAPQADKLYNAVDLMQLEVKGGSAVYVAHDDRLPRPAWLAQQFQPTPLKLKIDAKSTLSVFIHRAAQDESLTLGTNTENARLKACNMYVVFVSAAKQ